MSEGGTLVQQRFPAQVLESGTNDGPPNFRHVYVAMPSISDTATPAEYGGQHLPLFAPERRYWFHSNRAWTPIASVGPTLPLISRPVR